MTHQKHLQLDGRRTIFSGLFFRLIKPSLSKLDGRKRDDKKTKKI